jgi:hypothetical protein
LVPIGASLTVSSEAPKARFPLAFGAIVLQL